MDSKQPDPQRLTEQLGLKLPILGLYDAPDPAPFAPTVVPKKGACFFTHYSRWLKDETLRLTPTEFGCQGCGKWLCGSQTFSGEKFLNFLVKTEGLKDSQDLMAEYVQNAHPYEMKHGNLFFGPLRPIQWDYLKTVTFLVNLDQLAALSIGAQYHARETDPAPVLAPFGPGCKTLLNFADFDRPQSVIGGMDIAMRPNLPPNIALFTVTPPMFTRLCSLDERSFLYKGFWERLCNARL